MIYERAINSNLSTVQKELDCYANQVSGIVGVPANKVGGISKDPEGTVTIIYAIVSGAPMTVIERVDKDDYTVEEMAELAKEFNSSDCGFVMSFAENDDYYDVSVVGTRIIQAAKAI
ncbi:hypothetical protein [Bacteroides acidifaciens]|uniref:hypothetical protein n=1 Tax=Bacteroides acidifaciens TaxID=85831 RepID=UPI0025A991C4|nr:hypothetical protein [Bacteroides acidifaciens]